MSVKTPPTRREVRSDAEKAADRGTLWRTGLVFLPVTMFWALFNQVNSNLGFLQGRKMMPFHALNGETMQGAGSVLVMIWTPILTLAIYPLTERLGWRPSALRRMGAGMFLGAAAFVVSGLIQARMDGGQTMSILWQLAPYVVLEATQGKCWFPRRDLSSRLSKRRSDYQSVVMSLWLMTIAGAGIS